MSPIMSPSRRTGAASRPGRNADRAVKLHDSIYQGRGYANTMMVLTAEGNVVIDTSWRLAARRHVRQLRAVSASPVRYIILTHSHGDHTGGIPLWEEAGTKIIANRESIEFRNYQVRLKRFLGWRNATQFGLRDQSFAVPDAGNYAAPEFRNAIYFDRRYDFTLGALDFEVHHTPGETPDHATVWIPAFRAAFIGDNYYESFPNIYSLRGTRTRPALDYTESLNKVLNLRPEILIPSHGPALFGEERIRQRLTRYRDAILYVHDAVVKGMNEGKDVYTLMREIRLPEALAEREVYGKVAWSVRGIYEGYAGWFDLNPSSLYGDPVSAIYPDLVRLAGGIEPVLEAAAERLRTGKLEDALRLTEVALGSAVANPAGLRLRLRVLHALRKRSESADPPNWVERNWLDSSIGEIRRVLLSARAAESHL